MNNTNTLEVVLDEFKKRYLELSLASEYWDYNGYKAGLGTDDWKCEHAIATKCSQMASNTVVMADRIARRLGMKKSEFRAIADEWKDEFHKQLQKARDENFKNIAACITLYYY